MPETLNVDLPRPTAGIATRDPGSIAVVERSIDPDAEIAAVVRRKLRNAGVFTIALLGGPGCGKTTLVEATLRRLSAGTGGSAPRVGVIVGDAATRRDADRLARACRHVVQIDTGGKPSLRAGHALAAVDELDLSQLDALFIENVGNLACPPGLDLGQDVTVGLFSTAGGADQPAKHPSVVHAADVLLLTKTDLLPHVVFDLGGFHADVRGLRPDLQVIELSVLRDRGVGEWIEWVAARVVHKKTVNGNAAATGIAPEWFVG
jgi:hydrogenase nickel incorporation protein HypB